MDLSRNPKSEKPACFGRTKSARTLLEQFEKQARAAGYDFLLVISEPKTKDFRTMYHCEPAGHETLTKAIDISYDQLLDFYQAQGAKAGN